MHDEDEREAALLEEFKSLHQRKTFSSSNGQLPASTYEPRTLSEIASQFINSSTFCRQLTYVFNTMESKFLVYFKYFKTLSLDSFIDPNDKKFLPINLTKDQILMIYSLEPSLYSFHRTDKYLWGIGYQSHSPVLELEPLIGLMYCEKNRTKRTIDLAARRKLFDSSLLDLVVRIIESTPGLARLMRGFKLSSSLASMLTTRQEKDSAQTRSTMLSYLPSVKREKQKRSLVYST